MAEVVRFPFRNEKLICLAERYLWDVSYRPRRVGMAILLRYRTMGLPWDLSVGHLAVAANLTYPARQRVRTTLVSQV